MSIQRGASKKTEYDLVLHALGEVQVEISNIDFRIMDGIPYEGDWDRLDALREKMGELLKQRKALIGEGGDGG